MRQYRFWAGVTSAVLLCLLVTLMQVLRTSVGDDKTVASAAETSQPTWLYELRTYHTPEGKLDALHARFRDHTMTLFEKHGIKNMLYWTPIDKPNTLIYLIAHKDKATAEASWTAFMSDPEWKKAAAASETNGKLVDAVESVYLQPTDYSPSMSGLPVR